MAAQIMPMNIELVVIVVALAYASLYAFSQVRLIDRKRMRELQKLMKQHQKDLGELIKNKAPQEHIDAKQKELMPVIKENMLSILKPSLIMLPAFYILYRWLIPTAFASYASSVAYLIPGFAFGPSSLFFACSVIFGFVVSISVLLYDRKKMREEQAALGSSAKQG
ncbi:MAG: DUF106 domain-containing protein [Candidatus Micrarchaeota archaeon]|nr:DUF106 domain-containing protein [Candidatus Micrarchaeota archaeon]